MHGWVLLNYKEAGNYIIFCKMDAAGDIILTKNKPDQKDKGHHFFVCWTYRSIQLYTDTDAYTYTCIYTYLFTYGLKANGRLGKGGTRGRKRVKRERIWMMNVIKVNDKLKRHCLYNAQPYIRWIYFTVRKTL